MKKKSFQQQVAEQIEAITEKLSAQDVVRAATGSDATLRAFLAQHSTPSRAEALRAMVGLLNAHVKGSYSKAPLRSISRIAAMLVYLDRKFDLVPDFINVIGKVDDHAAVDSTYDAVLGDLKVFQESSGATP